jgi:hypothetical protein
MIVGACDFAEKEKTIRTIAVWVIAVNRLKSWRKFLLWIRKEACVLVQKLSLYVWYVFLYILRY